MTRGRKPKPTALRRAEGNPGKRGYNHAEPVPPTDMPDCPPHLCELAREEWHRVADTLHAMGVLTTVDRAALAAYCQVYARWVEAERRLAETPPLVRTPSGYVQQSPWIGVANRQLEIMGRYMAEFGMTPASRSRVACSPPAESEPPALIVTIVDPEDGSCRDLHGNAVEMPAIEGPDPPTEH